MTPDEKLDEALKETFPASDAFYVSSGTPPAVGSDADLPHEIPAPVASIRDLSSKGLDSGRG